MKLEPPHPPTPPTILEGQAETEGRADGSDWWVAVLMSRGAFTGSWCWAARRPVDLYPYRSAS